MHASFGRRFLAWLIDTVIMVTALYALATFTADLNPVTQELEPNSLFALCAIAFFFAYYVYAESSPWQGTLGKKILGIKVTDLRGNRVSFMRSLGRNLSVVFSRIFYIGYIMAAFTKNKQGLHDMLAGTLVLDKHAEPSPNGVQNSKGAGCVVALILLVPALGVLTALAVPQYARFAGKAAADQALEVMRHLSQNRAQYEISDKEPAVESKNYLFYVTTDGILAKRNKRPVPYTLFQPYTNNAACCAETEQQPGICQKLNIGKCPTAAGKN